ncbi:hypothetical protein MTR67_017654 [Solanum verrucosum]|uniref:Gnk2-homologous domain-containing protein n=1 Tax=Solanum verrucosum TaxID=315347 RepID=A0AAF0QIB8_SOLVR|nr:hypothetical protein MTR67_017654 [Solanum verrucosum]
MSGSFAKSLAYVLEALQNETPISQGYNYYVISPYPNDALAYGHATCTSSLINSDCATCANYAKSYLITACDRGIGAQIELVDCSMRYEQYSFVGKKTTILILDWNYKVVNSLSQTLCRGKSLP